MCEDADDMMSNSHVGAVLTTWLQMTYFLFEVQELPKYKVRLKHLFL